MGYFSNGSEGDMYEKKYCSKCVHAPDYKKSLDCPILALHEIWNYEQHGEDDVSKEKKLILESFIPQTEGHCNCQCTMFVEAKQEVK